MEPVKAFPGIHPLARPMYTIGVLFLAGAAYTVFPNGTPTDWTWFLASLAGLMVILALGTRRTVLVDVSGVISEVNHIAFIPRQTVLARFPEVASVIARFWHLPETGGHRVTFDLRVKLNHGPSFSILPPQALGTLPPATHPGLANYPDDLREEAKNAMAEARALAERIGCPLSIIEPPDLS